MDAVISKFNFLSLLCLALISFTAEANLELLCEKLKIEGCKRRNFSRRSNASVPTEQNSYRLNPSSIPTERGLGIETITDFQDYQAGIVTGTGRIGAAAGPNSIEDSFFGNMPIESTTEFQERMLNDKKYKSKKTVLAAAANIYGGGKNKKLIKLNAGLIGRYNRDTKNFKSGLGGSLEVGIFSFGYSKYKDENFDRYYFMTYPYDATIMTFGLKVPYFAMDYSIIDNTLANFDVRTTIRILSMTFFWRKWMFTYATRNEDSYRPRFDRETQTFEYVRRKSFGFLGVQYAVSDKFLIGLFDNYYLLNEITVGVTMFF